ncbi:MAG: bifunctional diaminohydroxyphosphoribosylaminopyrimidine deaminase/5-amino-6-(5-phosphoribosylamino)uracil reductase RibD [Alcanivorax sp.]
MTSDIDIHHMRSAIALARRGVGRTAPNPSVGCVVVRDDVVISRARTNDLGRPHAEFLALEALENNAEGATLYVTLEPCTHHGATPPCVDAIIKAKVSRVVIGALDLNPQVAGKSTAILQEAGIEVTSGVLSEECTAINEGFFSTIEKGRPFVTLKTACSLDGKIALKNGESQWITGDLARRHAHFLRSKHDAVMVGVGTVLKDNPMLTTRLDGVDHNPVRVVLDSKLKTPPDSILVKSAYAIRLFIFHAEQSDNEPLFIAGGVHLHQCNPHDLAEVLGLLAKQGITRILVEGGAEVHASFLSAGLCDELVVYRAPTILGDDSKGAMPDLNIERLNDRYDFECIERRALGDDMLERYRPKSEVQ